MQNSILFLRGQDYYSSLLEKPHTAWYENLYLAYYTNFKHVYLFAIWVAMVYICWLSKDNQFTKSTQSGGAFGIGKYKVGGLTTVLGKGAVSRMQSTGSALSKLGSKSTYTSAGKGVLSAGRTGIEAGEYMADRYKAQTGGISGFVAFAFLGIGFMVYIFPVLAMGLLGALTFFIARDTLANTFTA